MKIVFIGLSITSSWGNGHATTYRALLRALAANGHKLTFLEQDQPWYADNRDMRAMPGVDIQLYSSHR
jgi:spore maturation protein CgeB